MNRPRILSTIVLALLPLVSRAGEAPLPPIETVAIDVLLTVRGQPGELALARWIDDSFGPGADPVITAPDADPDRDGLSNWLEFATGGDPLRVSPPVIRIAREDSLGEGEFAVVLRHRRPRDPEIVAGIAHSS